MARKKRSAAKKITKSAKKPVRLRDRVGLAWRNLILFLIIFIFSFLLYSFSSSDLLKNFFGILSIIFGFLAFAFLIVFIVLFILKKARK
jgi:hypothetical protein